MRRVLPLSIAALLAVSAALAAQGLSRRATTIEAIREYPGFFNGQSVVLVGELRRDGERLTVVTETASLAATLAPNAQAGEGPAEVRGQLFDLGRMAQDDPRILQLNARATIEQRYGDRWPRPGEELLLFLTGAVPPARPANALTPPLRAVALTPERFTGQKVAIVGQFRGRNLFGDLPDAPAGADRDAFVLRSADAALWVAGLRPRTKSASLDPGRRVDTGRWLKATGTVRAARGIAVLDGVALEDAADPKEETVEAVVAMPPGPPLEVIFSAPADADIDVRLDTRVRLQFSRDVAAASIKGRVRVTYSAADSSERGEAQPPEVQCVVTYTPATRGLEIRPVQPLERFRPVKVELLEGITAFDGAPLAPFTLTFTTGGS
jgi:hypothetical protein